MSETTLENEISTDVANPVEHMVMRWRKISRKAAGMAYPKKETACRFCAGYKAITT